MQHVRWLIVPLLMLLSLAAGCPKAAGLASKPGLRVVVSIPPLRGLVEPLLPPDSTIEVLIPPGASEHGYEIPPARLAALATADLVVHVGLGMEPQVEKALRERPRAARRVIEFASVAGIADPGFDHDRSEDHDHAHEIDPHLWLDPILAARLVDAVWAQVRAASADPSSPAAHPLHDRVLGVDRRYSQALTAAARRTIIVGHDAWSRLADRYGLKVVAIKGLTAGEPTPGALREAIETIRREGLTTIFIEPQLSPAAAERIATAAGVKVAPLDPLGDGDWFALMDRNLAALCEALGVPVPPRPE